MAKGEGVRPRTLSAVFGAYVLLVLLIAFFLSDRVTSGWYAPWMIWWVLAAYLVLGALVLTGVCAGAVARQAALDRRLDALEALQREKGTASGPSDRDVEQLLADLEHVRQAAEAAEMRDEELAARLSDRDRAASSRRVVVAKIERLKGVREAVAAQVAGPAIASMFLIGVAAALLPASNGMLLSDVQLNSLLAVAGMGYLLGLVVYAIAAFRHLGRKAA